MSFPSDFFRTREFVFLIVITAFGSLAAYEEGEYDQGKTATGEIAKDRPLPEESYNQARKPIVDRPGLPRVLLIGDSISVGYTLDVRAKLNDVANVHRPNANCASTVRGLDRLQKWLGNEKWDVIHFNWGLHDLRRVDGVQEVPPEKYEKNLRELVEMLKKTGAKLIWATTTPVPASTGGTTRNPEDVTAYNAIAETIMKENGVKIDDLYAFALPQISKIQLPNNVHYTAAGSEVLAGQVASSIKDTLNETR